MSNLIEMNISKNITIDNPWWNSKVRYLKSEIPQDRYTLILRAGILTTAGSLIAIIETFTAIYLGLHHIPYKQGLLIATSVLSITSILVLILYLSKKLLVWHEWAFFTLYVLLFQSGFCFWIFRLGEIRFLAIINVLTFVIILLSYTSILQSFILSLLVLINYLSVSWYSINIAGQAGSFEREAFYSACLVPSFMLISAAVYYINKKREALEQTKNELERLNTSLTEVNDKLLKEQSLTEIEMDLASEIQKSIFPGKAPDVSDWDIAFVSKPYSAVSGDFYDFYSSNGLLNGVSLFDVSGHGVAPALITILAKPLFYNNFKRCAASRLGEVLESVSTVLNDELEDVNLYITGLILRMNGSDVEYVNAGHPDLICFHPSEKKAFIMKDNGNTFKGHPVGLNLSDRKYQSLEFSVTAGDYLVFYSDGLTESRNYMGESFGIKRLTDAILSSNGTNAAGLLEIILKSLKQFTGNIKAGDDITVIVAGKN